MIGSRRRVLDIIECARKYIGKLLERHISMMMMMMVIVIIMIMMMISIDMMMMKIMI